MEYNLGVMNGDRNGEVTLLLSEVTIRRGFTVHWLKVSVQPFTGRQ